MKILEEKWNGILFEGGFEDFCVNGSFSMEREVLYKNNPTIEAKKRLNMAYVLLQNPRLIDVMQRHKSYFFHGTNANALPSILKYGLNSVDTSVENDISVTTGETWSRINGRRSFVSLTDCLDLALQYTDMEPVDNSNNTLLNFGVLVGTSLENMKGISAHGVRSDMSEIGVKGNLPVDHIKFIGVPEDKAEFAKKMIGQNGIEVVSMDMQDLFFNANFMDKLNLLEQDKEKNRQTDVYSPTYSQADVKPVVMQRKTSKIKELFQELKEKIHTMKSKGNSIGDRG